MAKEVIKDNSTRGILAAEKIQKTAAAAAEADQDMQNEVARRNNLQTEEKKAKAL